MVLYEFNQRMGNRKKGLMGLLITVVVMGGFIGIDFIFPNFLNVELFPNRHLNNDTDSEYLNPTLFYTNITLTIDYHNGTISIEHDLGVEKSMPNVERLIDRYHDIEINVYSFGNLVISIDGISEDKTNNLFWFFWVNGTLPLSSANNALIANNTEVRWELSNGNGINL